MIVVGRKRKREEKLIPILPLFPTYSPIPTIRLYVTPYCYRRRTSRDPEFSAVARTAASKRKISVLGKPTAICIDKIMMARSSAQNLQEKLCRLEWRLEGARSPSILTKNGVAH